jgi:hypothetical protein
MRVYLDGTFKSNWRDVVTKDLDIDYSVPRMKEWSVKQKEEEDYRKSKCDLIVHTVTPKNVDTYSIAVMVEDSINSPEKTIVCFLDDDNGFKFTQQQKDEMAPLIKMVRKYGVYTFDDIKELTKYLNTFIGL